MQNGDALAALLCFLAFMVVVSTLIGAIILRAAVSLFNKLTGGPYTPTSVPEPSLGKAILITFATSVVNAVMLFAVASVTAPPAAPAGPRGSGVQLAAYLLSTPISLLVMASMLKATLPTSFGRAILITLYYIVVATLLALAIAAVIALVVAIFAASS